MVGKLVNIKNFAVFFHEWFKKPSIQIQSDVQEVDDLLIDRNKIQGEAILLEYSIKLLPGYISASGGLRGYCKPVIFVGSNIDWQMLNLAEEVENTDVTCLSPIIGTHCDVKVSALLLPNILIIIIK